MKRWRFNWPGVALLLLTPLFTLLVHHLAARKSAAVHQMIEELGLMPFGIVLFIASTELEMERAGDGLVA